jgi:hypothetical protein
VEGAKVSLNVAYDTSAQADLVIGAEATGLPAACDGQSVLFESVNKDGSIIHNHVDVIKNRASVVSCEAQDAPNAADVYATDLQIVDAIG